MPGHKIFVSYSSKDERKATEIVQRLRHHGHEVFDYKDGNCVGRPIYDTVMAAIEEADWVVFLLSSNSIGASWIDAESLRASNKRKNRFAFVLGQCDFENSLTWKRMEDVGNKMVRDPEDPQELKQACDDACDSMRGGSGFRGNGSHDIGPNQMPPSMPRVNIYTVHSTSPQMCVSLVKGVAGYGARWDRVADAFGPPHNNRWRLEPEQFELFLSLVGDDRLSRG